MEEQSPEETGSSFAQAQPSVEETPSAVSLGNSGPELAQDYSPAADNDGVVVMAEGEALTETQREDTTAEELAKHPTILYPETVAVDTAEQSVVSFRAEQEQVTQEQVMEQIPEEVLEQIPEQQFQILEQVQEQPEAETVAGTEIETGAETHVTFAQEGTELNDHIVVEQEDVTQHHSEPLAPVHSHCQQVLPPPLHQPPPPPIDQISSAEVCMPAHGVMAPPVLPAVVRSVPPPRSSSSSHIVERAPPGAEAFQDDLNGRLGRANGNVYVRVPGVPSVHDGQIMVRLKRKRFIVIDYAAASTREGTPQCINSPCSKVGMPDLLFDSNPEEPASLYLRSGLCFTCQRNLNEKRRTQRKKKGEVAATNTNGRNDASNTSNSNASSIPVQRGGGGRPSAKRPRYADPDDIVISGAPEGTKPRGQDGYDFPEIGEDIKAFVQAGLTEIEHMISTATVDGIDAEGIGAMHEAVEATYGSALLKLKAGLYLITQWKGSWDEQFAALKASVVATDGGHHHHVGHSHVPDEESQITVVQHHHPDEDGSGQQQPDLSSSAGVVDLHSPLDMGAELHHPVEEEVPGTIPQSLHHHHPIEDVQMVDHQEDSQEIVVHHHHTGEVVMEHVAPEDGGMDPLVVEHDGSGDHVVEVENGVVQITENTPVEGKEMAAEVMTGPKQINVNGTDGQMKEGEDDLHSELPPVFHTI